MCGLEWKRADVIDHVTDSGAGVSVSVFELQEDISAYLL